MTFSRIIWAAGAIAYLIHLMTRLGSAWAFQVKIDDAIALLLIAGVAQLVWAPQRGQNQSN